MKTLKKFGIIIGVNEPPSTFDIHDVMKHLVTLWDDVQKLKKEVRELKKRNDED